jgi:DNA/RNA endonuclease YhcR with UshA esterase domain
MKRLILSIAIMVLLLPLFAQTITPIANIQDSISYYNNRTVTIQGIVTIGARTIHASQLRAYIQDSSGRGMMLYNGSITAEHTSKIVRGYELKVTGKVTEYQGVTEITNMTSIEEIDRGLPLPVIPLTIEQAQNYQYYEGTYVKLSGSLTENPYVTSDGGANITIEDDTNKTIVYRVWPSTNIDYSNLTAGIPIDGYGVVSIYSNAAQVLPAYQSDFVIRLTEPLVNNIQHSPVNPFIDQPITVTAKIIDYNGTIDSAKVYYRMDTETDFTRIVNMTHTSGNDYSVTLPAFNTLSNEEGDYYVYISAWDNDGIQVDSPTHRITVLKRKPVVSNIRFLNQPNAGEDLTVQANVADSDGRVIAVKVLYSTNYSQNYTEAVMDSVALNIYEAIVPGQKAGTILNIKIWAEDDSLLTTIADSFDNGQPARYVFPVTTHKAVLKVTPKVYNIYNGDQIEIGYFFQSDDKAIIRIYNSEGKLITTPVSTVSGNTNGINFYTWNGKDKNHQHVEPGLYICHLEVTERATGDKKTYQVPIVIGMKLK